MSIRYFYKADCFCLNQSARLYYPFQYRLTDFVQKICYININSKAKKCQADQAAVEKISARLNSIKGKIDWEQNLLSASFVIFDTETTGLQPFKGDKIISLAGVIVEKGAIKEDAVFDTLINPLRPIPPLSTDITGITGSMVSGAPTLLQVLPEFLDFIGNRILVAHCAPFDLAFLNIELGRHTAARILNPVIDTYLLAQCLLPELLQYSLENLLKSFGLEIKGRHTSLGDSMMTAQLFLKLLEKLAEKEILTLNQLYNYLLQQRERASV